MRRIALVLAATAALATGVLVDASGDSGKQASAATSAVCVKIGHVRWCFRSTAAEVAETLNPAASLTGNGAPSDDGPPVGLDKITFNTPSVPGGQTTCTNAGTFMDCH